MSKKSREFRKQQEVQQKALQAPQSQEIKIGIAPPPDHIFKFRKNRAAPAQDIWGAGGTVSYIPQRAEYIEGEGNFVYHYMVPFPSKTVAPVEAIHAIAGAKRLTINELRFFASISPLDIFTRKGRSRIITSFFRYFNDTADMMAVGFYLEDGYYCKFAKEVRKAVKTFLMAIGVEEDVADHSGEIFACFFEYDNAYRTRPQDLASETTKEALLTNLPKELDRLISIQATRETVPNGGQEVVKRFRAAAKVLKYAWWFPKTRKALKQAIEAVDLEKCRMDEADIYHTILYGDYNVGGKVLEERIKLLEQYHGLDQANWPPRIMIRNSNGTG